MIDLHSHLLPGVDDGAPDDAQALSMARMAVADGICIQACTPHMFPGVYDNKGADVRARVARLQSLLDEEGIPLSLVVGADLHIAPDLVARLSAGDALGLHDTRYVLIETPHHVLPPRVETVFFDLQTAGYVPILTHPERMSWIEQRYDLVQALAQAGVWMQLTAGALTGGFGSRARYWAERMLEEGLAHIVATDAHDTRRRPPLLRHAFDALCARTGEDRATAMVQTIPYGMLENRPPEELVTRMPRLAKPSCEPGALSRVRAFITGRR